jgi:DNA-binding beta-propeller fold protein YncE
MTAIARYCVKSKYQHPVGFCAEAGRSRMLCNAVCSMTHRNSRSNSKFQGWVALGLFFALISTSIQAASLKNLTELVFVVDAGSPDVAVISTRLDEVIEVIRLDRAPDRLLISEETGLLVAGSDGSPTVSVFALDPFARVAQVDVGFIATHFRLSPDGKKLALNNPQSGKLLLMSLLDGNDKHSLDDLGTSAYPTFDRKGKNLFVASRDGSSVHVVDMNSVSAARTIDLGMAPQDRRGGAAIAGFARTPGGGLGFVMKGESDHMSVIDLRRQTLQKTVRLQGPALRAFPTANSQYLLVPDADARQISVISTWSYDITARLRGARDVVSVTTALFDMVGYVASGQEKRLVVLDLVTVKNNGEIKLPGTPADSLASADGLKVYVALSDIGSVAVIDAMTHRLLKLIEGVGSKPSELASVRDLSYCH